MSQDDPSAQNTDRELYRDKRGDPLDLDDYYSPSVHVTKDGEIGMNAHGVVVVMPIEAWISMAVTKAIKLQKEASEQEELPFESRRLGDSIWGHVEATTKYVCSFCEGKARQPTVSMDVEDAGVSICLNHLLFFLTGLQTFHTDLLHKAIEELHNSKKK